MVGGTINVSTAGVFGQGASRSGQTLPTPTNGGIAVLTYQGTSSTPATTSVAPLCSSTSCPVSFSAPIGATVIVVQIYSTAAPVTTTIPGGSTLLAFGSTTYTFSANGTNSPSITLNATTAGSPTSPGGGSTVQTSSGGGVSIPTYVPNYTASGSTLGAGTSIGFTIPTGAGLSSNVAAGISDVIQSQLTVTLSSARAAASIPSYAPTSSSVTNYFIYGFALTLVNTASPGTTVTAGSPLCIANPSTFVITNSTLQNALGPAGTLYIAQPTGSTYTNVGTIAYTFSGNTLTTGTCTSTITQNGIYIIYLAVPANSSAPVLIAAGTGTASSGAASATLGSNQTKVFTFSESGATSSTIYTVTGSGTACANLNMSTHNTTQVVGSGVTINQYASSVARSPQQAQPGATDLYVTVSPSASGSCTLTVTSSMTGTPSNAITITVAGPVTISQNSSTTTSVQLTSTSAQTFTVAQTNGGTFSVDNGSTCAASGTSAAATYSAASLASASTFTVTAVSNGSCTVIIDSSLGQSATLTVTVSLPLSGLQLEVDSPGTSGTAGFYTSWLTSDSSLKYLVVNNAGQVPLVVHGFNGSTEFTGAYTGTITLTLSSSPSNAFTFASSSSTTATLTNPTLPATLYMNYGAPSSCTGTAASPNTTNCVAGFSGSGGGEGSGSGASATASITASPAITALSSSSTYTSGSPWTVFTALSGTVSVQATCLLSSSYYENGGEDIGPDILEDSNGTGCN